MRPHFWVRPTGVFHETHIPAQCSQAQAHARLSCPHGNRKGPPGFEKPPRQRAQTPGCLSADQLFSRLEKTLVSTRTTASFGKSRRLPGAREFKSVFDSHHLRVSSRYGVVLARYNQLPTSRLGVVVSKKNIRTSVQRTRIKRLCREYFRLHQGSLRGLDIVVMIKNGADALDNASIRKNVGELFAVVLRKKNEAIAN